MRSRKDITAVQFATVAANLLHQGVLEAGSNDGKANVS